MAALPAPATPWQPRSLPAPAWRAQADMHSTSTVTDSTASASASPCSSRPESDSDISPRSSPNPRVWPNDGFEDDYDLASPFTRKTVSVASRALPRCAVVNFSKDGDNLRWAPRATQNASGVAARVHNFEDAFSLEEFSSRALPVVWHARGGNPRISGAEREEEEKESKRKEKQRSKSSMSASQKSLMRTPSLKRTMVMAKEFRRPSFWSLLAHSNRIQKSRAQRLAEKEVEEEEKAVQSKKGKSWSMRIRSAMSRSDSSKKKEVKRKSGSFFRRFMEKGESKETTELPVQPLLVEERRHADRMLSQPEREREAKPGSIRMKKRNIARASVDGSRVGHRRVRSSMGTTKKKEDVGPSSSQDDQYVTFITSTLC